MLAKSKGLSLNRDWCRAPNNYRKMSCFVEKKDYDELIFKLIFKVFFYTYKSQNYNNRV